MTKSRAGFATDLNMNINAQQAILNAYIINNSSLNKIYSAIQTDSTFRAKALRKARILLMRDDFKSIISFQNSNRYVFKLIVKRIWFTVVSVKDNLTFSKLSV